MRFRRRLVLFFAFLSLSSVAFGADIYNVDKVDFPEGVAQLGKSGKIVFSDDFVDADVWSTVVNYRDVLNIEFNREIEGRRALFVTRTTPLNPDDPEDYVTAWNVGTAKRPVAPELVGREYALRAITSASKLADESATDQRPWRGAIEWFDRSEKILESTPFWFYAEQQIGEIVLYGQTPENAAFYTVNIGFDIPDFAQGDWVVVHSVTLEGLTPDKPYCQSGSFTTGVLCGGQVSWDAEIPQGCSLKFQVATADSLERGLDSFSDFVGVDGTSQTYYDQPFKIDARYVRFRVLMNSDGCATPAFRSLTIDGRETNGWRVGDEFEPPVIRIVGARAKPSRGAAPLSVEIRDRSFIEPKKIRFMVDGVDETSKFELQERDSGATWLATSPEREFEEGLHKVEIQAVDGLGNSVESTRYFLIGDETQTPQVTLREDGTTLIDGKPFFPIGIYGVTRRKYNDDSFDVAFQQLQEAGFNFAHSYFGSRSEEFFDAAEKYGFKIWSPVRFPDEQVVEVERRLPIILAWYLGDDTACNTTKAQLDDYRYSMEAVDPTRLTVQADCVDSDRLVSNYRRYATGTTAFLPEIYPLKGNDPNFDDAIVARVVKDVKRCRADVLDARDGPKAIWPILQTYKGWHTTRFMTYRELRASAFAALVAGGNGVTWFYYCGTQEEEENQREYGAICSREVWRDLSRVVKQVRKLSTVFLEPSDKSEQPRVSVLEGEKLDPLGGDSVVASLKRQGDAIYVFAVNASPRPCVVRLEFPREYQFDGFERLFDEKELPTPNLQKDALIDDMEGFGVRVYSWRLK